jgi:hypothetical protein
MALPAARRAVVDGLEKRGFKGEAVRLLDFERVLSGFWGKENRETQPAPHLPRAGVIRVQHSGAESRDRQSDSEGLRVQDAARIP